MTTTGHPWVVISDYPSWPSPYFAQLAGHAPPELGLCFRPGLATVLAQDATAGVVNLHRLKRLYRDPVTGHRTRGAARALTGQLDRLSHRGWKVVWTVHNLLPIDGGTPSLLDQQVAGEVLSRAAAVITHTRADATALRRRTTAPVVAAGWAGLPAPAGPPEPVLARLASDMRRSVSVLCLGNITDYKNLPELARRWHEHPTPARLFLAGPARDHHLLAGILRWASDRVRVHPHRVAPGQAGHLYAAATAALCPYRVDGPYRFFTEVLHPSSVGTARCFGVPIIAPELPAIVEMTTGHTRLLYPPEDGPGPVLDELHQRACGTWPHPGSRPGPSRADQGWPQIIRTYWQLAQHLNG
ncbi:MAG: hypothetical protein ACRDRP_08615 [Pseudonocardiaceae bacterium]